MAIMRLLTIFVTLWISIILPSGKGDCIDLTPYANNAEDLHVLVNGGDVSSNAPVFFDIPSRFVNGQVVYCLENIMIPQKVGLTNCQETHQCWLASGMHADKKNNNDLNITHNCTHLNSGDTSACYDCACTGSSMNSGSVDLARLGGACGLSTDSKWGLTCRNVENGRNTWFRDVMVPSNYSNVYVPICSEPVAYCNVCQGGIHPSFRVGIQWISDLDEQCFKHPFNSGCNQGLETFGIIGIAVGSTVLVIALVSLYFILAWKYKYSTQRQRQKQVADDESVAKADTMSSEGISYDTELD